MGISSFCNSNITSYWSFSVVRRRKTPADMRSHCKIDFIFMICVMGFQYRTVYQGFRYVIGNEFCPDFLFNILRFIGVKVTQPYGVFQFSERRFDSPPGIVQCLDLFRLELIMRQIRNDTFKR